MYITLNEASQIRQTSQVNLVPQLNQVVEVSQAPQENPCASWLHFKV